MTFVLAHGPGFMDFAMVAYLSAMPGVIAYCGVLAWALAVDRRKGQWLRGWGAVALGWAWVFPPAFTKLIEIVGGDGGMFAALAVCSGVSAALLWMATRSMGPVTGCGIGLALASLVWVPQMGPGIKSPFDFLAMEAAWVVSVCVSLVVWGRARQKLLRDGSVCEGCGYDMRGTLGRVCPECGTGAAVKTENPAR